ncbi:MAG: LodA/GoxA family CTQ-dependent oxidase [Magnetovibrio sp.]|nr:LodA/GoxA family CTQ-dependent oxidase [Magnetovibrio sp.]
MVSKTVFRVHPSINFARLGTSEEYYLSPETSAGLKTDDPNVTGGLPIKPGTENEFITSDDLRDATGNMKRQAARFRLYAYDFEAPDEYPNGGGREITPGDTVFYDGKDREIQTIVWTVHLANKKSAAYNVVNSEGVKAYEGGKVPQLRNPEIYGNIDAPTRLRTLMIDPGPRAIKSDSQKTINFNSKGVCYCGQDGAIKAIKNYPTSFPSDTNSELYQPSGTLDSLGQMKVDEKGRLLVLTGLGNTAAIYDEYGDPMPLTGDLNNAGWWDDGADGPVSSTVVFKDGAVAEAFGGWVVCTDPSYAPQIRNITSVWDDAFDVWVQELDLMPELYKNNAFVETYQPSFFTDIRPIFAAPALQEWTVNLPKFATQAHTKVNQISPQNEPYKTIMSGLSFIRNPNAATPNNPAGETNIGIPLMPLSLGQAGEAFLTVTKTQYFFLEQWNANNFKKTLKGGLNGGEQLDFASLSNCLGGRYVPGVEVSYVIRSTEIYHTDWRTSGSGPFRVKPQPLDYSKAKADEPFLSGGWIPGHDKTDGLQPGDLSKFMAIPWQTDYNSCSIHQTHINTAGVNTSFGNDSTLYWSWPSQRPDAVYRASDVVMNVLPTQAWSIRGPGTFAANAKTASTFQKPLQAVEQWDRIGFVLQGSVIGEGKKYSPQLYLEVESQLDVEGYSDEAVAKWPFNAYVSPPKHK